MTPEELQDYVVYSVQYDAYAYWGKPQADKPYCWCLVKPDAHGYPMSLAEADAVCRELSTKYGGEYLPKARQKAPVICVKAV